MGAGTGSRTTARGDLGLARLATITDAGLREERRGASERKFRTAVRHSRRVRALRIVLPIAIVLGAGATVAASYFNPIRMLAKLPIDPGRIVVSGTKVTMQAPRLAGFTRDARPYELTAQAASQDITRPDLLELKQIHARVEMQSRGIVEITADNGLYDTKADLLTLRDNVLMVSSAGYEGRLDDAVIEVKSGKVVSQNPVKVKMLNGTLDANRVEVDERGDLVRFGGGVVMNMRLEAPATDGKAPSR